jgi:hypothetical protein
MMNLAGGVVAASSKSAETSLFVPELVRKTSAAAGALLGSFGALKSV